LVLDSDTARRWFYWLIAACALYIASQALLQFATGHNLYGDKPGLAGELTGPFNKPRAGPPLSRLLPPILVPLAALLAGRRHLLATIAAYALLLAGMCVMVLINQRMPLLLTGFAFVISALLLPRLRPAVVVAAVAGLALIATSAVVSPKTHARLVTQFSHQMEGFASSHYGLIYARSLAIAEQHPFTGRGFDGFRTGCPEPRYFRPSFDGREPNGGGASICTEHPHNFYAEALTNAGIPGLILFTTLGVVWLLPLWRNLVPATDPLRVGLFASILIQLWPLASTSGFTSMPMGGWLFLLLGWALAVTRSASQPSD
jgi:O-antigen ligase